MYKTKPMFMVLIFLLSSLSGCIGLTDNDDLIEKTEEIKINDVECYGDVETNPECDIDFSVGQGIEPMISSKLLAEFESNDYDSQYNHHHDGHSHSNESEIPEINYSPNYYYSDEKIMSETSGRSHAQTQNECTSDDLIGLSEQVLVDYLISHTHGCLYQSVVIPLDSNVISVFTDENIVFVSNIISEIAPLYDGDNSEGVFQLMFFIHEAYYHEWYGQIEEFEQDTTDIVFDAIDALKVSPYILNPGEESRKILNQLIGMADTVDAQSLLLSLYVEIMDIFPTDSSFYEINQYGFPSYTQRTLQTVLVSIQRSAHYTEVNAHLEIFDLLEEIREISVNQEITNGAEVIVSNAVWSFGRFAYTTPPYSENYYWTSVNDMYDLACEYLIEAENFHYSENDVSISYLWALNTHETFYTVPHEGRCVNEINDLTLDEAITELENQLFSNDYSFDDGNIIIRTPLDVNEVIPLYYSIKEVQAQYFRLTETSLPVDDDPNSKLTFMIYGSKQDYQTWQPFLYGLETSNGGIYIEQWGQIFTYQRTPSESIYTLDELVRHEYVHYLDGRYLIEEMWGENDFYDSDRITWFNEGLAEFLVGSSSENGIVPRETIVDRIQDDGSNRMSVGEIFESSYGSGFKFYRYSAVLIDYMYHDYNYQLRNLIECVDLDDVVCYDQIVESLANDNSFVDGYQSHIDGLLAQLNTYTNPMPSFISDENLEILDPEYISNDINSSNELGYTVVCNTGTRTLLTRHRCIGTLYVNNTVDETTDNTWHTFDRTLNLLMQEINTRYSEGMVCWFDRILVEDTIRERYNHSTSFHCEVPVKIAQYGSNGILANLELDASRTRANDSIDCMSNPSDTENVYTCKIKIFSDWFEAGTDNDILFESLEMYAREIGNQIHAANPVVYAQYTCSINDESLEYNEIDNEGVRYASAFLQCSFVI